MSADGELGDYPAMHSTEYRVLNSCLACESGRPPVSRGLCARCYHILRRQGWLEEFPRLYHRAEAVLEDWSFLREQGISTEFAASRLGMTQAALEGHLDRALRRGDPRGRRRVA